MRFPASFQRRVGGVAPPAVLGTDVAPVGAPPSVAADNMLYGYTRADATEFIMMLYTASVGSLPNLPADIFFWEERSATWYILNKNRIMLQPGRMVAIPAPALNTLVGASRPSDTIQLALVIDPLAAPAVFVPPAGIYTFSWGIGIGGANAKTTLNLFPLPAIANAGTILGEAGSVSSVFVSNPTATAGWLMFFDKATAAVNTDVPILRVWSPASSSYSINLCDEDEDPVNVTLGLQWAVSTTPNTLTIDGAATYSVQPRYS